MINFITLEPEAAALPCPLCKSLYSQTQCYASNNINDAVLVTGGICLECGKRHDRGIKQISLLFIVPGLIVVIIGLLGLVAKNSMQTISVLFGFILILIGIMGFAQVLFRKINKASGSEREELLSKMFAKFAITGKKNYSMKEWQEITNSMKK